MGKSVNISHSSKKIQELCKKKNLSFEGLYNALLEKDGQLNRETVRSWYYRDTIPRQPRLQMLCSVLDCDSDYILGRNEETTRDRQFISNETGLSDDAIAWLQKYGRTRQKPLFGPPNRPLGEALSFILTNENGRSLLMEIVHYLTSNNAYLTYKDEPMDEDITIHQGHNIAYSFKKSEFDSIILAQIQRDLVQMRSAYVVKKLKNK